MPVTGGGGSHSHGWARQGTPLSAGSEEARLSIDGHEIELQAPRLVKKDDIWPMLPATTKTPPSIKGDSELLRMDIHAPEH